MDKTQRASTAFTGINNVRVYVKFLSRSITYNPQKAMFLFQLHAENRNPLTLVMSDCRQD